MALKRKWDASAYGDAPTRVRILHEFDTYVEREKESVSAYGVNYTLTGFKGHLGEACTQSEPLRPSCYVRVVSRPARSNYAMLHNLANLLVRDTERDSSSPIYISNHENCPLRPMVLAYGEIHPWQQHIDGNDCAHLP